MKKHPMKKRIFRNPNLVLRRKKPRRLAPESDYTDDEVYQQSLKLRRIAKRITGSPFIRLNEDEMND